METDADKPEFKYAVKSAIPAHSGDVRVVRSSDSSENFFATGSRDNLVKLWRPDENGIYKEAIIFVGATKYIASLCVLPSSRQFPDGLILAGSNDSSIYGFAMNQSEPVLKLLGHNDTVCSLSAGMFGTFVSGSWDKTARVWSGQQCSLVLSGHQQAVWATEVFPEQNLILTGSADCTIRLWCSGHCEKVYSGHMDCVRGLALVSDRKFLSCSNDCSVRLWEIGGECLEVYLGHSDYIYGITVLDNGIDFATCSEDHTIKIWKNGVCSQSLAVSNKTLWSITRSQNGNLAVGSSDGTLYILQKVPPDYVSAEFEGQIVEENVEMLSTLSKSFPDDISPMGTISYKELEKKGEFDGQTVLIFDEQTSSLNVFVWNAESETWVQKNTVKEGIIGNLELSSDNVVSSKEKIVNFKVDVEGVMYDLEYNINDNPWDVARKFVTDHNLVTDHVGQIAEFIIKNGAHHGYSSEHLKNSEAGPVVSAEFMKTLNEAKYIGYSKVNGDGLAAKLVEFNFSVSKEQKIPTENIEELLLLTKFPEEITTKQMASLDSLLMWNDEFLFPVLDLVRIAVKCVGMYEKVSNPAFINHLLKLLTKTQSWMNRNLILKIFCNMFGYTEGNNVLEKFQEKIFCSVKEVLCSMDQRFQKAGAALFLNYAVLCVDDGANIDCHLYCVTVMEFLPLLTDDEAVYRMCVAIVNMTDFDESNIAYFDSLNIIESLKQFRKIEMPKLTPILDLLFMRFGE